MLIYNPPHGKSIRVPKTFVLFEKFVFKEKNPCSSAFYPRAKNIRDVRAIRVQRKNPCSSDICGRIKIIIRVPKIFDSCSKEKIRVHLCVPKTSIDLIHAYIYFMSFLRLLKC